MFAEDGVTPLATGSIRLERWEGLRAGSAVEKLEVNRCSVLHSNKLRPNLFGL